PPITAFVHNRSVADSTRGHPPEPAAGVHNPCTESRPENLHRSTGCGHSPGMTNTDHRSGDLVGYARVSTQDQHTDLQLDALRDAGVVRIFQEKASGTREDRPELAAVLDYLRPGDTLVVWR